jgi:hypothetical protein
MGEGDLIELIYSHLKAELAAFLGCVTFETVTQCSSWQITDLVQ